MTEAFVFFIVQQISLVGGQRRRRDDKHVRARFRRASTLRVPRALEWLESRALTKPTAE